MSQVWAQGGPQQEESEYQRMELPKRERDWKPSAFYLSYDVVQLINSAQSDRIDGELNGKIDFDQFFLAFDFGWSDRVITEANFDYRYSGQYYRVGPEINFMPYNKSWSSLFFGFKYSWSNLEDQILYFGNHDEWSPEIQNYRNEDISAWWLEANFGLSARIVGPLYMGYVVRFKMSRQISGAEVLNPFYLPGFGRADRSSNFGFSYYITYRFGLRDKPVPMRPEKAKRLENTNVPTKDNE